MFDIGWDEMALIAVVSLIVIGPKDLPVVLRQVGRWTRKAREMAADFQRGMDDMARESELAELKQQVAKVAEPNLLRQEIDKAIDPTGEMAKAMEVPTLDLTGATQAVPTPEAIAADAPAPRPPEP
ncbi:twin arginine-targeting protein translocase TatB [Paramagnetospirillum marisnigri]|uniref:Sec-independent protein translocase protein TatB n=1 Tax=Paramagnetospirillum marisnigri TaxID=1285242 RepID=A0A178M692_9PROT|nr:Sec-independent protein translocase protein TatB [Paramagnetospirillum marisnigri]OAN44046.1 twin arginine-targeting protein translocase TatB [Paramagnetospirillum marisnigri]